MCACIFFFADMTSKDKTSELATLSRKVRSQRRSKKKSGILARCHGDPPVGIGKFPATACTEKLLYLRNELAFQHPASGRESKYFRVAYMQSHLHSKIRMHTGKVRRTIFFKILFVIIRIAVIPFLFISPDN